MTYGPGTNSLKSLIAPKPWPAERAQKQKPGVKHPWSVAALLPKRRKKRNSLGLLQHSKNKEKQPKKQRQQQKNQLMSLHRLNVTL